MAEAGRGYQHLPESHDSDKHESWLQRHRLLVGVVVIAIILAIILGVYFGVTSSDSDDNDCKTENGFIETDDGHCVFPSIAGLCPNNYVDCSVGCVNDTSQGANLCQGGQCIDGDCVPHNFTWEDADDVALIATEFLNCRMYGGDNCNVTQEDKIGDTAGGLIRWAFHDAGPNKSASGCLLVRPCNGQDCEFESPVNTGLQEIMELLDMTYDDAGLAFVINKPDFYYYASTVFLNVLSGNQTTIPFRWGRKPCPCLTTIPAAGETCSPLPYFPDTMPDPEMSFDDLADIFQTHLGFSQTQWLCLLGAHALGRMEPQNAGYAREWDFTPALFSNQFYTTLNFTKWMIETNTNGQTMDNVTDPNQPVVGKTQYQSSTSPLHTGNAMLPSDCELFWVTSEGPCNITHDGVTGCEERNDMGQFDLFNKLADPDPTYFYDCFADAFQMLSELGQDDLHAIV